MNFEKKTKHAFPEKYDFWQNMDFTEQHDFGKMLDFRKVFALPPKGSGETVPSMTYPCLKNGCVPQAEHKLQQAGHTSQ